MEQIIGIQSDVIKHTTLPPPTRQSVSYGEKGEKKKPLGYFEVSFPAPDIPLYADS